MRVLSRAPQRPAVTVLMLLVLGLAFVAPLVPQQSVLADPTEVVENTNDAGAGSLRQAIADVDVDGVITFDIPGAGPHTITLTSGELVIDTNLTISGPGADLLTVSGNDASRVFRILDATVEISGLTISGGNSAQGSGFLNYGALSISDSTISGNTADSNFGGNGGGIFNAGGTLSITNSTISGNDAIPSPDGFGDGGGINNVGGTLSVINSTISGNSADRGGGIFASVDLGIVDITNSTIVGNSASPGEGGGIHVFAGAMTLTGTIVAGSRSGGDCTGSITSAGYNLASDDTCFGSGTGVPDLFLGPLQDNGGPTQTHALLAGSPAIDAIPVDDCPLDVDVDQRGVERPLGDGCDIGAVEFNSPVLTLPEEPIIVEATSPDGAEVTFDASAVDWENEPLVVSCEASSGVVVSGDTFPVGDTTVTCSASDSLNQTSEGSFTITVTAMDTGQLLADLEADVRALDMPFWERVGLTTLLGVAERFVALGSNPASCTFLDLFTARVAVLSPETISADDAARLIDDAQTIQQFLGCRQR